MQARYQSKRVAIAGFGVEGRSAYEYYKKHGAEVVVYDQTELTDAPEDAQVYTGEDIFSQIKDVDFIVRSPSVKPSLLPDNISVTSSTIEFFDRCPAKIIGVTGTKGKGTTCSLIGEILTHASFKNRVLGNIGIPALDALDEIQEDEIIIYELSSFQLWDLKKSPQIAVILMITEDHLDTHVDMSDYLSAKANIVNYQTEGDKVFHHPTNEQSISIAQKSKGQKIPYIDSSRSFIEGGDVMLNGIKICPVTEVALLGEHNLENICAAISVASEFTDDSSAMAETLQTFRGLEHRLELAGTHNAVKYINDSISTIPSTAIAAMKAFSEPKIMILGGKNKGLDLQPLIDEVPNNNVKKVITIGEIGPQIQDSLIEAGYSSVVYSKSFESAFELCVENSEPGDVVLLSPATSSYDMFKTFAHRGKKFKQLVGEL